MNGETYAARDGGSTVDLVKAWTHVVSRYFIQWNHMIVLRDIKI